MASTEPRLAITWLGHATFLLRTPGGLRVLIDPWLADNPACPASWKGAPPAVDLVLVTHGHPDHVSDAARVGRACGAPVVAMVEICRWLQAQGVSAVEPMNIGGTIRHRGVRITMVDARHSSAWHDDGPSVFLGAPAGFVIRLEDGRSVYFAGDTDVFGDMRLIRDRYAPEIAFLPIGDRFTMGPDGAALACELLGVRQVVPMHYGTFPLLTGTPADLRACLGSGVEVLELRPGETAS